MPTDHALLELAARQHGLVTRPALRALGYERGAVARRVASGLVVPVSGPVLRVRGAPRTDHQHLLAAVLERSGRAVASHDSAAALWGLPGWALRPAHVVEERRSASHRPALGIVHTTTRLAADDCTVVDGIPTTTPLRLLTDLAAAPGGTPTSIAALYTTMRGRGLVDEDGLRRHLATAPRGRPGTGLLRPLVA